MKKGTKLFQLSSGWNLMENRHVLADLWGPLLPAACIPREVSPEVRVQ